MNIIPYLCTQKNKLSINYMKKHILSILALVLLFSACQTATQSNEPLQPKREMRAAWISTVANIDWPSRDAKGNAELQKAELTAILDSVQALNMNAVIFQIRPTADALYYSELEPWSNWLTGTQGVDNDQSYDPLLFAVEEAHRRGIDVHVWMNPYRVTTTQDIADLAETHIYRQHPEWFCKYGKQWYFEPGLDETRMWLNKVVADVVTRYDIDAIHFDDYFYPYPIAGQDFPDEKVFKKHPRGFKDKGDWRRNNVNLVIQELQTTIKSIKPWVEFGISPFGIWRNEKSDSVRGSATNGLENYDALYADILLWLENGWIDYVVPQLYWEIGKKVADYEILAHWWAKYTYGKNLYIGQSPYRMVDPTSEKYQKDREENKEMTGWDIPNEICRQITLNRSIPEIQGSVFFPVNVLLKNHIGTADSLRNDYYRYPALQPISRNLNGLPAVAPAEVTRTGKQLSWTAVEGEGGQATAYYVVYAFPRGVEPDFNNPAYILARTTDTTISLPSRRGTFAVTTVNKFKQESEPCFVK